MSGDDAVARFRASMVLDVERWRDGTGYDLDALRSATPDERRTIESILLARGAADWRDVEALAALDTPAAREALAEAVRCGPPAIRLAVHRYASSVVPDAVRTSALVAALGSARPFGGLAQAIDEAADHHPPAVVEALLRGALRREGGAAVHFAALLAWIHGKAAEPFDWDRRPFYLRFATEDRAAREAAFRDLCAEIGADPEPWIRG